MILSKWPLTALVAGTVLVADQLTKVMVWAWLAPTTPVMVIPGIFDLRLVMNPGVAFGLMSGGPATLRIVGLTLVALVALAVMVWFLISARNEERLFIWGLALTMGGAIGNVIDRTRLGAVIDFLYFYWGRYHWPAFNVADAAITIGVGLTMIHLVRASIRDMKAKA